MRTFFKIVVGLSCLALVARLNAAEPDASKVLDAQTGFELLKTLEGKWQSSDSEAGSGPETILFNTTGAGSAVVATFNAGTAMEMLSLFHLDGPTELVQTHYCAIGNQPTMRLVKSDKPGELAFQYASGTNLDPQKDGHVHNTTFRFLDKDKLEAEVEFYNEGKLEGSQKFTLARVAETAENKEATTKVEPKSDSFTASDGVKIHYLTAGDKGSAVVLIHGYTGSAQGNWFSNGVADALAKNHRIVAIDVRGHGQSEKPHDAAKYGAQMFKDVFELMDHLKIEKAHIHGYSMGGAITTQLLILNPDRFITASYGGSGIRETDPEQQAKVPADREGSDPQESEASSTLRGNPDRDDEALAAVGQSFRSFSSEKLDLSKIKFPVLAINGEFDKPNAKTHRMQRELANFKSVVLPGKSHLTAIMAGYIPDLYIDSLVEFIDKNDPHH